MRELREAGIRLGWGTDWVAVDPWDVMRFGISVTRLAEQQIDVLTTPRAGTSRTS